MLTLDADSVILPEYCLRLVYLLEQEQYAHVGVAETPYSAYPGRSDPDRADRRCHDRSAAHHPPGDDALQRLVLGRSECRAAQARPRRRRRVSTYSGDWPIRRYIQRPHRHRGHRVDDRPHGPRLDRVQLPGAPQLQRHAARLRLTVHPAPPLGERRPADRAETVFIGPGAPRGRSTSEPRRDVPPPQLHGVDLLELDLGPVLDGFPVQRAAAHAAHPDRRGSVLRRDDT